MTHTRNAEAAGTSAERDATAAAVLLGAPRAGQAGTHTALVAPVGYADSAPRSLERIGVVHDGSTESDTALDEARRLAERSGARVIVRDVMEAPQFRTGDWSTEILAMNRALQERVRRALGTRVSLELSVALGPARLELAAFSDAVDLLICGSRHLGLDSGADSEQVRNDLARRCTSPVLIVTSPTRAGDGSRTLAQVTPRPWADATPVGWT